ncbi:DUF1326 domain-containing protein [Rhodococcus aetherivorans]|uniref:DUF1326 domain-containing protein n=1 Tax=Rhodococcus aetherivorans TaxID=191292 RepID=UPI0005CB3C2B|nr:DUF1326 domain-containing protein [Rhodococcus aetherivorans]
MTTAGTSKQTRWHLKGQWFDICSCILPCGCTMAQPPTDGVCYGTLVYQIDEGYFGELDLSGLTVVTIGEIKSENLWDSSKPVEGIYDLIIDERADTDQRDALERLWTGQEGGWIANLVGLLGTVRQLEFAPIECRIEGDLARWSIDVPGRVSGAVDALSGPTTPPGQRVQTFNPPGSETGGSPATWGVPTKMELVDFGFLGEWTAKSSKHIPFDWSNE